MNDRPRRLLSVAHSYVVALNRGLASAMARVGASRWEVTAVAPLFFHGDSRPIPLEMDRQEGFRLEAVPAHFSSRIHVMAYGRRLRTLLREPWDLVHCWEEPYILAGGQVAWWTPRNTPLVYATFQNLLKRYVPPFCWLEQYAMHRAAGCIAFGHTVDQTLAQRPLYSRRSRRVIPLGVDLDHFHPDPTARERIRRDLDWELSGPPTIGYLGRLVPEKGLPLFTRVLDRLSSPWRALVVGSGPMEKTLREWSVPHGNRVRIVTDVKHDAVYAYLNAMDVLCAPSQTTPRWREQLGRMLLEAFACAVPVIASNSGEIPYVVQDAGVIVGEKDEVGWVQALTDLLESPARRADLSARGLERARTVYAWSIIARQHLDFFDELLDGRCRR